MTTREAIILKYWVPITVSWLNRRLTTTPGRPAQKPFMMCHPLEGLIQNRDKGEEVLTFVQSKFYFKRVMRLRCNFVLKKKLVLYMVKSLRCFFLNSMFLFLISLLEIPMGQGFDWKQYDENSIVSPISDMTGVLLMLHYPAITEKIAYSFLFPFRLR